MCGFANTNEGILRERSTDYKGDKLMRQLLLCFPLVFFMANSALGEDRRLASTFNSTVWETKDAFSGAVQEYELQIRARGYEDYTNEWMLLVLCERSESGPGWRLTSRFNSGGQYASDWSNFRSKWPPNPQILYDHRDISIMQYKIAQSSGWSFTEALLMAEFWERARGAIITLKETNVPVTSYPPFTSTVDNPNREWVFDVPNETADAIKLFFGMCKPLAG